MWKLRKWTKGGGYKTVFGGETTSEGGAAQTPMEEEAVLEKGSSAEEVYIHISVCVHWMTTQCLSSYDSVLMLVLS